MSVKVIGANEVADYLRGIERNKPRIYKSWLRDRGVYGVASIKRYILNVGAVDTNELIQGIHYETETISNGQQVTIKPSEKADKYASYVEHGTRPHFPPIEAIRPWAERKGLNPYLVARAISKNGTDPRHFARDSFNQEIKPDTVRHIDQLADRLIRGI